MSTALKTRKPKTTAKSKKTTRRPSAQQPSREVETALPTHVVGKPPEVEPVERAFAGGEEPESAMRSAEAPDAGYGRCTESSDWENRGRS